MDNQDWRQEGISSVPEEIISDGYIKKWQLGLRGKECPLVIEEETYHLAGLARKLYSPINLINKLKKLGILEVDSRCLNAKRKRNVYYSNLSVARIISWAFGKPVKEIIISEKSLKEDKFLSLPYNKRLKILFKAYKGCYWLDVFMEKQRMLEKNLGIVKIRIRQRCTREELEGIFVVCKQKLLKFRRKGFLPSTANDKDKRAPYACFGHDKISTFFSFIFPGGNYEIITKNNEASYEEIANNFLNAKLKPYFASKKVEPLEKYSLPQVIRITQKPVQTVYSSAKKGYIKNIFLLEEKAYLLGIDLAIYHLRHGEKRFFTIEEIRDMLGVSDLGLENIGLKFQTDRTVYSSQSFFKAYNKIAAIAREKFFKPEEFEVKGKKYGLSLQGKRSYVSTYDLKVFDDICFSHLQNEILGMIRQDEKKIETPDLMITVSKGNIINSVRLK